jgi:exodeoxyribonuclease VII small subunit
MAKTSSITKALTPALPERYEDALLEIERLVAAMESAQLPLDTLLANYQRGAELLGFCHARVQAVQLQVQQLENGQLKPWLPT